MRIIDQRALPGRYIERDLQLLEDFVAAIQSLAVRGAPAIGIAASMGLALLAETKSGADARAFFEELAGIAHKLRNARPTAVNLAWAVDRTLRAGGRFEDPADAARAMRREADAIREEDRAMCRRIGEHGSELLADGMNVLTHCNTGALATGGIGTALAAIYVACEKGLRINVFASETRPLLQGSRLTAWELSRAGIPVTVVGEGAVASLMRARRIDACIVGADRITRNGDVANKIGTFSHAVAAQLHNIPFYVAAPNSTVDAKTASGAVVEIEERPQHEILNGAGHAASAVSAYNPAFDITPANFISAIVTDSASTARHTTSRRNHRKSAE